VRGTINNAKPQIKMRYPVENDTYVIDPVTGKTTLIPFEIIANDPDDILNVTWDFDDGAYVDLTDCNNGANCNFTYEYDNYGAGARIVRVTAKETTRAANKMQSAYDLNRIFIFKEGYTVFVLIDYPNYKQPLLSAGVHRLDASSSFVSNCTSLNLETCQTKKPCLELSDILNPSLKLWCYTLAEAGTINPGMIFAWMFDRGTSSQNVLVTNSTPFYKAFLESKEHTIDLKIDYTINL
jgi:hypothetical protein